MNIEYKDFIGLYRGVYPDGYCQHLISEFERLVKSGAGYNRQQGEGAKKHAKNDMALQLNVGVHTANYFFGDSISNMFFKGLQECFDAYTEEFSVLKDGQVNASVMKMQRTSPGGGYHIWHGEQGNGVHAGRALVYMLYLNTLDQDGAGETEFLYQKLRVPPEENMMIIWPAAYTHAHRGNVVHGTKDKYVVTGWFCYE